MQNCSPSPASVLCSGRLFSVLGGCLPTLHSTCGPYIYEPALPRASEPTRCMLLVCLRVTAASAPTGAATGYGYGPALALASVPTRGMLLICCSVCLRVAAASAPTGASTGYGYCPALALAATGSGAQEQHMQPHHPRLAAWSFLDVCTPLFTPTPSPGHNSASLRCIDRPQGPASVLPGHVPVSVSHRHGCALQHLNTPACASVRVSVANLDDACGPSLPAGITVPL